MKYLILKHSVADIKIIEMNYPCVKRTVFPCGFGAFNKENFYTSAKNCVLRVVYDCGASTIDKANAIQQHITNDYNGQILDVLFISHFHRDHVNCIDKLPINDKTLIVLPYIHHKYQFLFEFFHGLPYTSFVAGLVRSGYDKIILVDPFDPEEDGRRDGKEYTTENLPKSGAVNPGDHIDASFPHIKPFDTIYIKQFDWLYTPFHLQDLSVFNQFLNLAKAQGITEDQLLHYDGTDDSLTKQIKGIYDNICKNDPDSKGNLNASSLLLVSQPKTDFARWSTERVSYPYNSGDLAKPRYKYVKGSNACCLYTGDTPLSTKKYNKEFKMVINRLTPNGVGIAQLPHHGSAEGYDDVLVNLNDLRAVFVNCTETNGSRVPKLCTKALLDCARQKKAFYAVSEDDKSMFKQTVSRL